VIAGLKQRINDDVKAALKQGEKDRVGALRLVLAALKQREVDERIELDDSQILAVLEKLAKQRRESITLYVQGNRADLAAKERFELDLITGYLPQQLSPAEIEALVCAAVAEIGATSVKDMGKVMAALKPRLQGRADMGAVGTLVRQRLS
jgi:hypothetical protein